MPSSERLDPQRQRRDKLPPAEKRARHLEANRSYYARNRARIQEEQRIRSKKYREKLKLEKRRTELHPNRCPRCGQLLPVTGNDLQGSDREPAEPGLETDES